MAAPSEGSDTLADAVFGGEAHLNLRLRAEIVDATSLEGAQAYTERLRAGYGSKPFNGFSFYFDFEDIRTADDDLYNASGIHGDPAKAVVADPEATELNQGYLKYQDPDQRVTLIGGRQRITLDDHRFVGDVGWRQNEQTFDAATVIANLPRGMTGQYSYLWDINRVFGQGFVDGNPAISDFRSDSHLFNLSKDCEGLGTVTGFAYLLDFDNSPANSSDTYGVRYQGSFDFTGDYSVDPVLSYASQSDNNANPASYDADYYLAQVSVVRKGTGSIGAGYEVLGGDNGSSFQTPLATGHAFNGWFDSFLTTPAAGLEDIYLFAAADLPGGTVGKIFSHWFAQNVGGNRGLDLGKEIDVLLTKKVDDHVSILAKYAYFDGENGFTDGTKFWLQTEIKSR